MAKPTPEILKHPPAEMLAKDVQVAVDSWYRDNMYDTVVSRHTDVHNLIHSAKPALVSAVVAAVLQTIHTKE